jgi:hypothetical protein
MLGWYFGKVLPQKYGTREPWYFLFKLSFWSKAARDREAEAKKHRKDSKVLLKPFVGYQCSKTAQFFLLGEELRILPPRKEIFEASCITTVSMSSLSPHVATAIANVVSCITTIVAVTTATMAPFLVSPPFPCCHCYRMSLLPS